MSHGWRAAFWRHKGIWVENNSLFLLQIISMFNLSHVGQEFRYLIVATRLTGSGACEVRVGGQM